MMNHAYNVYFKAWDFPIKIKTEALRLGFFSIKFYAIIIVFAFVVSAFYVYFNSKKINIKKDDLLDLFIYVSVSSIIGARLYFVIFSGNKSYFKDPFSIFKIYEGGLAIYGGIIAAVVVGIFILKRKKIKILPTLDLSLTALLLGQAIGRWGNFFNQEAFGTATDLFWGMKSENTFEEFVHPCFLYESLWCLIGFFVLNFLKSKNKKTPGKISCMYAMWYGFGRFFIESLRTDSLTVANIPWLRISQVVSLLCFVLGTFILFVFSKIKRQIKGK